MCMCAWKALNNGMFGKSYHFIALSVVGLITIYSSIFAVHQYLLLAIRLIPFHWRAEENRTDDTNRIVGRLTMSISVFVENFDFDFGAVCLASLFVKVIMTMRPIIHAHSHIFYSPTLPLIHRYDRTSMQTHQTHSNLTYQAFTIICVSHVMLLNY